MIRKENGFLRSLFISALITVIVAAVTIISGKKPALLRGFISLFSDGIYEVKEIPKNLRISREVPETLKISEISRLRSMLLEERFEELNAVLEKYQKNFEINQTDDFKLCDAYNAFAITVPSYEDLFKKWISAAPESYQPYLASAHFYYEKGWESRGFKWKRDTSEGQFEKMKLFFSEAEDHLSRALKIKPELMPAYKILIGMYNAAGPEEAENEIIKKSLELFPYSFLLRFTCSWAKEPRWGGAYPLMEEMASHAERYSDKNPRFSVLYGLIYFDQAKKFRENKQYEKSLELFNKAISYGDHWVFFNERAKTYYYYLKTYDQALEDINQSIEINGLSYDNYLMRSKILFAQAKYGDSIEDLRTAEFLTPGKHEIQKWKKWAGKNLMNRGHRLFKTDIEEAAEYYDLSIAFDDENFEAYYWRGRADSHIKDDESALSDFKAAVKLNPHHFESYRMIDYLLSKSRKWETIIYYWDKFIELEPDHADAYYERSGTHYHNKDLESAVEDLQTACRLGNKNACKRYNAVKK